MSSHRNLLHPFAGATKGARPSQQGSSTVSVAQECTRNGGW